MAWHFQPIDDKCVDCERAIDIKRERHYIVFAPDLSTPERDAYKRCCAACYDKALSRPYNRRSTADAIIMGEPPSEPNN